MDFRLYVAEPPKGSRQTGALYYVSMLAMALLALFQKTDAITLTVRARPLSEACKSIGELSGLHLDVKGTLGTEPLILNVKGIEPKRLMEKIAEVVDADWKKVDDTHFELWRSSIRERSQLSDHIARRSQLLRDRIAKFAAAAGANETPESSQLVELIRKRIADRSRSTEPLLLSPSKRALSRLLLGIDAAQLAAIEPGSYRMYSSKPTKMQLPLPSQADSIMGRLNTERRQLVVAAESMPGSLTYLFDFQLTSYPERDLWDGRGTVTVKLIRQSWSPNLQAEMTIYDSNGKEQLKSSSNELGMWFESQRAALPIDPTIHLTPDSKAIHEALMPSVSRQFDGIRKDLSSEIFQRLTNPDKWDPLSFTFTDVALQAAAANNVNLIAFPDDDFGTSEFNLVDGKTRVNSFISIGQANNQWKIADGWLSIAPADRFETRRRRTDRSLMREYISRAVKRGYVGFEERLFLAEKGRSMPGYLTGVWTQSLVQPIRVFEVDGVLPFFASLSQKQRKALTSGGSLVAEDLTAAEKNALEDWVFRTSATVAEVHPGSSDLFWIPAQRREPTTSVGDGLLTRYKVSASVETIPVAVCYRGSDAIAMDAVTLATNMIRSESHGPGETYVPPTEFRSGSNTRILLRVTFEPGLASQGSINSIDVNLKKPATGMDGLPSSFRKDYETELARLRAAREGSLPPGVNPLPN